MTDWNDTEAIGKAIHGFARTLWPLPRSISGAGLRATLAEIGRLLPGMQTIEVASGTQVLDWIVPDEWRISEGWIEAPDGTRILDFARNNLHVVGYSTSVDAVLSLQALQAHLHSLPEQPDAVPYVTSYYQRRWGFCLSHRQRQLLAEGDYRVRIVAGHFPGAITLGELLIPGETRDEVLLSSYCCHPSMANNELSGPCLLTWLARWLASAPRRLSYRIVFVPEMIGSIAYLALHRDVMRERTIAGFNLSCVGDERAWSYLPSRHGDTLADRVARHVLGHLAPDHLRYGWRDRGSDESNYCAPGIDLPVASVMRSKYGTYPEYHTSLDDLETVVTPRGLGQSFALYRRMIEALEGHQHPVARVLGEPQLGRRGLYPSLSMKGSTATVRTMLDLISMADGRHSLLDIADACDVPVWDLSPILDRLCEAGILAREGSLPA
jgi:aminopeptidase-like protein